MCTTWTAKSQIFLLQGAIAMELAIHQQNAQIREALQVATVQQGKFSEYYFFSEMWVRVRSADILEITCEWFSCYRFGVCCLFIYNSASTSVSENCSYIQNPNFPSAYGSTSTISWTVTKCAPSKIDSIRNTQNTAFPSKIRELIPF